jgi:hypothetical protein
MRHTFTYGLALCRKTAEQNHKHFAAARALADAERIAAC